MKLMKNIIRLLKPGQIFLTAYFFLFAGNILHHHYFHVHTSACKIHYDSPTDHGQHASADLLNGCYFSQNFSSLHNAFSPDKVGLNIFYEELNLSFESQTDFITFFLHVNSPLRAPPQIPLS